MSICILINFTDFIRISDRTRLRNACSSPWKPCCVLLAFPSTAHCPNPPGLYENEEGGLLGRSGVPLGTPDVKPARAHVDTCLPPQRQPPPSYAPLNSTYHPFRLSCGALCAASLPSPHPAYLAARNASVRADAPSASCSHLPFTLRIVHSSRESSRALFTRIYDVGGGVGEYSAYE